MRRVFGIWSERLDSNQRPSRPERDALPSCATLRFVGAHSTEKVLVHKGLDEFFSSPGFPWRKSKDPVARSSRRGLQETCYATVSEFLDGADLVLVHAGALAVELFELVEAGILVIGRVSTAWISRPSLRVITVGLEQPARADGAYGEEEGR